MPGHWYEIVAPDAPLSQGDIVFACPVIRWSRDLPVDVTTTEGREALKAAYRVEVADVIVLTQACDLEQEKVDSVVLCPHFALSAYRAAWEEDMQRRGQGITDRAWNRRVQEISNLSIHNFYLLDNSPDGPVQMEHRVVDFYDVYTVPRSVLEGLLKARAEPRLRLMPPYSEKVSQQFGHLFSRIALPHPVSNW